MGKEDEEEVKKLSIKRGKASSSRKVTFEDEPLGETKETSASPALAKPASRLGRAASKAASDKIANDVAELSNLNKKKRRPDSTDRAAQETKSAPEPAAVPEPTAAPAKRGGKRKAEAVAVESSPPKRATRGRKMLNV